ncbi:helix-turn-helix domain-containing protein [Methylobacterium sp. 37f]|uniref:helix-turn-helix domain-containing protein n=1 Tax=Methylobacterium sp. 37f TaxID=2817058 RepID=UPI001FFD88C1|nr:helix-turn-helix domain-containing protein [Methylobacterium sp. 37f]MCK2054974.1 hypothetical protein [Methylobacterium sp. 37f]
MTESPPKPRREVKVDISGLSSDQVLIRRAVILLGERAFGPRWQSDLAAALSIEANRRITQAQVSQWISGQRPVPEGLVDPLQRLALRKASEMESMAAELRADWAPTPPAEDIAAIEVA